MHLEPVANQLRQKELQLDSLDQDRRRAGRLRQAESAYRQWNEHRQSVKDDLLRVTEDWAGEDHSLSRWMVERLGSDIPLDAGEQVRAEQLFDALRTHRHSKVAKRLSRRLDKLTDGHPRKHPDVLALNGISEEDILNATAALHTITHQIDEARAEFQTIRSELHLGEAMLATASELGLGKTPSGALVEWRPFKWPLTVLARPERTSPLLRKERG
jgi:hypothetical protein